MPKGPSKEQLDTLKAYRRLEKLRDEAAVKSMEKHAVEMMIETAKRKKEEATKKGGRRRSKKTRRTRRH